MEYELGGFLRERYRGFISSVWRSDEVKVRSTDYDRTLMSAQCVLAKFYYPDEEHRFLADVNWIPTPIHTAPKPADFLLNVDESCPRIESAKKEQDKMPEVKKMIKKSQKLFNYLTEKSGSSVNTITLVDYLFDTLEIEKKYNLTLPDWVDPVWNEMREVSAFSFKMVALSEELKRLKAGPLLKLMRDHMKNKVSNSTSSLKMYMYSGHDTNVAAFLQGLRVYNDAPPPYAACVLVELYRTDKSSDNSTNLDDYYVKVSYFFF